MFATGWSCKGIIGRRCLKVSWITPFQTQLDSQTESTVHLDEIDFYLVEPEREDVNEAGDSRHFLHWLHQYGLTVRIHGSNHDTYTRRDLISHKLILPLRVVWNDVGVYDPDDNWIDD